MTGNSPDGTLRFAIVGENIGYTLSPQIHRAIFRKAGLSAAYEIFDVNHGAVASTIHNLMRNYDGFNVTKPYKADVHAMVETLSPEAVRCGNVNTVRGSRGFNTDYTALRNIVGPSIPKASGQQAIILGSGSAAMTSAIALSDLGMSIGIICRNPEAGYSISDRLVDLGFREAEVRDFKSNLPIKGYVAVNAISSGTFEFPAIGCKIAINFNYGERGTNFIKSVNGMTTIITGEQILLEQAIEAERIWLGKRIDVTWDEVNHG